VKSRNFQFQKTGATVIFDRKEIGNALLSLNNGNNNSNNDIEGFMLSSSSSSSSEKEQE
jgi:uncharacterized protein Smg (DUF494 family)